MAQKKKEVKAPERKDAKAPERPRVRVTMVLSDKARMRLATAALSERAHQSEIVDALILRHLPGYSIHVRGDIFDLSGGEGPADREAPSAA